MWLAGCAEGNVVRFRADVDEPTARQIEALVAQEPPTVLPESLPVHLNEYLALLSRDASSVEVSRDITFIFPSVEDDEPENDLMTELRVRLVTSDAEDGAELVARLRAEGMPQSLIEMGFVSTDDFWAPWCVVVDGEDIVSVAFTARLSANGAEAGVATPPPFRGRGFATLATRCWSRLEPLRGHSLFYSTDAANISSQRVAQRLRLDFLGPGISIN